MQVHRALASKQGLFSITGADPTDYTPSPPPGLLHKDLLRTLACSARASLYHLCVNSITHQNRICVCYGRPLHFIIAVASLVQDLDAHNGLHEKYAMCQILKSPRLLVSMYVVEFRSKGWNTHLAAQCETPPHIAQYPCKIVSQRGIARVLPCFHIMLRKYR